VKRTPGCHLPSLNVAATPSLVSIAELIFADRRFGIVGDVCWKAHTWSLQDFVLTFAARCQPATSELVAPRDPYADYGDISRLGHGLNAL
jgi:hypothetical protein